MSKNKPEPDHMLPDVRRTAMPILATVSDDELLAELARGLTLTADHLTRLGAIWAELERRGRDLSDLRKGLAEWLPHIAAGRLAAEAIVAFATRRGLLRALEGVPMEQQRRIAAGELIQVIDPAAGPDAVAELPAARIPAAAVRLVFADGEVRTPQAQRLALRPQPRRQRREREEYHYRPHYDKAAGTVTVGRMTIQLDDLLGELSAAAGPDRGPLSDDSDQFLTVKVRLSKIEHQSFLALCRRHELPDWEMIRKAMRAFGLI